ncbi:hypothetical protein CLOM_g19692 [Closterium sp. NIES-68]|nr:hypothetical protein CLOM_g19692 [Closterium sp. NIES-68]GJP73524.1 hypothetical protein CLOP_g4226 [Closterium sp. NIES-67]GJP80555.1 hypothetical protein CLOP_g10758 [Closterium sp. NIES-67]
MRLPLPPPFAGDAADAGKQGAAVAAGRRANAAGCSAARKCNTTAPHSSHSPQQLQPLQLPSWLQELLQQQERLLARIQGDPLRSYSMAAASSSPSSSAAASSSPSPSASSPSPSASSPSAVVPPATTAHQHPPFAKMLQPPRFSNPFAALPIPGSSSSASSAASPASSPASGSASPSASLGEAAKPDPAPSASGSRALILLPRQRLLLVPAADPTPATPDGVITVEAGSPKDPSPGLGARPVGLKWSKLSGWRVELPPNLPDLTKLRPEIEKLRPALEARVQHTLSHVPFRELLEEIQQWSKARGGPGGWAEGARVSRGSRRYPNKQKLSSVQDFFQYAESEGRRLFAELDTDGDGQVRLEDLERALKRRRLPVAHARPLLRRLRRHWLAASFGWEEFQSFMEAKEPAMLRAFTSLCVGSSGTLQKGQVFASLEKAGLPATESNVRAMMRFLDADESGHVTYGDFRNFLLLLPPERLQGSDPSMVWYDAATMVPMAPPAATSAPAGSVIKSALAGGLASGLSTCLMHPLDTIKTRVQASSASLTEVVRSVPSIGLQGLYRGAPPAILGQFACHGVRTGAYEASKMLLTSMLPNLTEYQVQPVASLCSTVLGTALRIPCEVLKQQLQAGLYDSTGAALRATLKEGGVKGLFRGTTATLCREVPFYVFGMLIYLQVKRVTRHVIRRELAPWETLLLGGFSGGMAAIAITPFDVIKTRMMTSPPGAAAAGMLTVGANLLATEGVGALYKGWLPRFFWIAPLGAMNFAGYELAKQAIDDVGEEGKVE